MMDGPRGSSWDPSCEVALCWDVHAHARAALSSWVFVEREMAKGVSPTCHWSGLVRRRFVDVMLWGAHSVNLGSNEVRLVSGVEPLRPD